MNELTIIFFFVWFLTSSSSAIKIKSNNQRNEDLVFQLKEQRVITSDDVALALLKTDRQFYSQNNPYIDAPQPIGYGATISAPHMHAIALEILKDHLKPGARVLDVGSGSGYLTACFIRYLNQHNDKNGIVIGIEHQPELVKLSKMNIQKDDPTLFQSGRLKIVEGDGRNGYPKYAPYDVIHVGAASPVPPAALIDQLNKGGRLLVPVGPEFGNQNYEQYDKDEEGNVVKKTLMSVIYVPLTDLKKSW